MIRGSRVRKEEKISAKVLACWSGRYFFGNSLSGLVPAALRSCQRRYPTSSIWSCNMLNSVPSNLQTSPWRSLVCPTRLLNRSSHMSFQRVSRAWHWPTGNFTHCAYHLSNATTPSAHSFSTSRTTQRFPIPPLLFDQVLTWSRV